jgi:hypothetical protein
MMRLGAMTLDDRIQIHHAVNLSIGHRKLYYRCAYGKIDAYISVCIPWTTVTSGLGYIEACMFSDEKEDGCPMMQALAKMQGRSCYKERKCETVYVPDDGLDTSIISKELMDLIVERIKAADADGDYDWTKNEVLGDDASKFLYLEGNCAPVPVPVPVSVPARKDQRKNPGPPYIHPDYAHLYR